MTVAPRPSRSSKNDQEFQLDLDQIVPEYQSANLVVRWLFWQRLIAAQKLKSHEGGRLLDAGCGSGLLIKTLRETGIPASSLYGVDLNENIERLSIPGCQIQRADIHQLPFDDGYFETIYCLDILEHIRDLQPVLAELKRVLTVTGNLIVSIPMENIFYRFCRLLLKGTTSMDQGPAAGVHYWQGEKLHQELQTVFALQDAIELPLSGPIALFRIVRLRLPNP